MENNWAAQHLETIRTLMERSALYRRALAPIATFVGLVGLAAAATGWALKIDAVAAFAIYWMLIGLAVTIGALVLVRRQASGQGENFWSPPTRRVAQAMAPALLIGLVAGLVVINQFSHEHAAAISPLLILAWTFLYGLALHAAGFFMPRGIRLFGWGFLLAGLILLALFLSDKLGNVSFLAALPDGSRIRRVTPGLRHLFIFHRTAETCSVNPQSFPNLDRIIHEQGRLGIMSLLAASPELSFTELRDSLGMTDGNVTTHIRTLQEAGYVSVAKSYQNNRPLTTCSLTAKGRQAFAAYINVLEQIVQQNKPNK